MAAANAHLAALVEQLRPMVSLETRALVKTKAKSFVKVCAELESENAPGKFVCCNVINNTEAGILQVIQKDLWKVMRRWLEDALPPGKRDEVVDPDGLITQIVKCLRKLRAMWLQTGDGGAFFGKALMRIMKTSNAELKKLSTKVADELFKMRTATTHSAADDETPKEIAEMYGVDVDELLELNDAYPGITRHAKLEEGTKIDLPERVPDVPPKKEKPIRVAASTSRSSATAPRPASVSASSRDPSRGSSVGSTSTASRGSTTTSRPPVSATPKIITLSGPPPSMRAGKQPARPAPVAAKMKKIVKDIGASRGSILSQISKTQPVSRLAPRRPSQDGVQKRPLQPAKPRPPPTATASSTAGRSREKMTVIDSKNDGSSRINEVLQPRKRTANDMGGSSADGTGHLAKRQKKAVQWGDGWSTSTNRGESWRGKDTQGLVQIKLIPPRDAAHNSKKGTEAMKFWEMGDEKQHFEEKSAAQGGEGRWASPVRFLMPAAPPDEYLERDRVGVDSTEKTTQETRERVVLRAQYFAAEHIPPSAAEPDAGDCFPDDDKPLPTRIPLEYVTAPVAAAVGYSSGPAAPPAFAARDVLGEDALASLVRELVSQHDVLSIIGGLNGGGGAGPAAAADYNRPPPSHHPPPSTRGYEEYSQPHHNPQYSDGHHQPQSGRYDGGGGGGGGGSPWDDAQHAPYGSRQGDLAGGGSDRGGGARHNPAYGGGPRGGDDARRQAARGHPGMYDGYPNHNHERERDYRR